MLPTERHEEATEEHRQELRLSEALGDVLGGAVASRKVGECYAALGNYSEALSVSSNYQAVSRFEYGKGQQCYCDCRSTTLIHP